jgi:hypothetical protein
VRVVPLTASGDVDFSSPILVDSPAAVAQCISTRLKLWETEWFLDTSDGTPWTQDILGRHPGVDPNASLKQRILGTPGVQSIVTYASTYTPGSRAFTVGGNVDTIYGPTAFSVALQAP